MYHPESINCCLLILCMLIQASMYLLKVNNRSASTMSDIYSKVTIKTPERRYDIILVYLLLTYLSHWDVSTIVTQDWTPWNEWNFFSRRFACIVLVWNKRINTAKILVGYVGPFGWVIIETLCKNSERQTAVNYFHQKFSSETFQGA